MVLIFGCRNQGLRNLPRPLRHDVFIGWEMRPQSPIALTASGARGCAETAFFWGAVMLAEALGNSCCEGNNGDLSVCGLVEIGITLVSVDLNDLESRAGAPL